jgi:hypothetical protein
MSDGGWAGRFARIMRSGDEGTKLNTASTRAPLSGPNTAKTLDAIVMGAAAAGNFASSGAH